MGMSHNESGKSPQGTRTCIFLFFGCTEVQSKVLQAKFWRESVFWNTFLAMAAKTTIVEVDEIVETGELDPEIIVTPHIFVNRIVEVPV